MAQEAITVEGVALPDTGGNREGGTGSGQTRSASRSGEGHGGSRNKKNEWAQKAFRLLVCRQRAESTEDGDSAVQRKLLCCSLWAILALAVLVAIILQVVYTRPNCKEETVKVEEAVGAQVGQGLTRRDVLEMLARSVSSTEALSTPGSPQHAALEWLITKDQVIGDRFEAKVVVQRYIMALVYSALWSRDGNPHSQLYIWDYNFCNKWKTYCWDDFEGIDMVRSGSNILVPLSPDVHECLWDGVGCYEGTDTVGAITMMHNNSTGTIPTELGMLNLEVLLLPHNKIRGTIPEAIFTPSTLEAVFTPSNPLKYLSLAFNQLTGTVPDMFDYTTNLRKFDCSSNQLTGSFPQSLNGLQDLELIDTSFNSFSGTLPLDFSSLPSLGMLEIGINRISGSIPTSIGSHNNITLIGMFHNQLTGTIPASLGALSNLKAMHLSMNLLSGSVPSDLFDMPGLLGLTMVNNNLDGTIPEKIGNLSSLEWLNMDANSLTGTLPSWIERLQSLWKFGVGYNLLTGTIPEGLGNLTHLRYLMLGHNHLDGSLPSTLRKATKLEIVDLSDMDLTGSINFLCDNNVSFVSADCGGEAPEVMCDCCLFCCNDHKHLPTCTEHISVIDLALRYCSKPTEYDGGAGTKLCGGSL